MIALVDCNNFYASCERLFQPQLRGRPIIVLSNNDGCVIARSDEAKELGIQMGTPAFLIEHLLRSHEVVVFSSNYTLYGSISDRVMAVLQARCEKVEVYSIDEAFLHLEDFSDLHPAQYATDLQEAVRAVGIPVSIGLAPSKTLAKMANRFVKKNRQETGVHILDNSRAIEEVLSVTRVEDIWGVGPQYARLLQLHGFRTAADLARAPEEWVRKHMTVVGQRLWRELHGLPCNEFAGEPPAKKNICVARSFGRLLSEKKEVKEALANYVATAARKLRRQDGCCRAVSVFIHNNNFRTLDKQYYRSINVLLPVATSSTRELLRYADIGLNKIWRDGFNFKKAGVILLDLVPASQVQTGIFDQVDRSREERLMKAMDSINRGGKELVKFAVQGYSRKWRLRQERLSPCYTTRMSDVLTITI